MSALNKKSFLTYLKEGGIYGCSFSFAGDYYFPGSHFLKFTELE